MTTDPIQLLRVARAAIQKEDYSTAVNAMQQLVQHDQESGNRQMEIIHRGNLALLQNRLGFSEEALENLKTALKLTRDEGDRAAEDGLLGNIGTILREIGEHDEAVKYLNEALIIAQEIGDTRGRGNWLSALGLTHDDLRHVDEAVACHTQAVQIARSLNDQRGLAQRLGHLGNTLMSAGRLGDALAAYEESIDVYRQLGDQPALALRLGILGNIYAENGRALVDEAAQQQALRQALAYYSETLEIARELNDTISEAALMRGMGNVYGNLGDFDAAIQHFQKAVDLFGSLGMAEQLVKLQENIQLAQQLRDS